MRLEGTFGPVSLSGYAIKLSNRLVCVQCMYLQHVVEYSLNEEGKCSRVVDCWWKTNRLDVIVYWLFNEVYFSLKGHLNKFFINLLLFLLCFHQYWSEM